MKTVKPYTFVTAIQRNAQNKSIVYYVQCPSLMDVSIAVSGMRNFKLTPRRQQVSGFRALRERCAKIYREHDFDLLEFRTVELEEEARRYRLH